MSLPALNPPLGPQPYSATLYSPETEILTLPKNGLADNRGDFTIKTLTNRQICAIRPTKASSQKTFHLPNQTDQLFLLRKRHGSASDFTGDSAAGYGFSIHGHFRIIGARSTVKFVNASDGAKVDLDVEGDWLDDVVQIKYYRQVVAEITKASGREGGDAMSVFVKVAPNVDLSLMAAVSLSLEARQWEKDAVMKMHRFGT